MVYHHKSKVRFSKEEVWSGILQVLVFFCQLLVTTYIAFSFHDVYFYYYHISIQNMFMEDTLLAADEIIQFKSLYKISDWWAFLENIVRTNLYNIDLNGTQSDAESYLQSTFWMDNIMIGMPKLRQIRAAKQTCRINTVFNRYFNNCYARYEPQYEDKQNIFKSTPYLTYEDYQVSPVKGLVSQYVGPGYVQFLTYNATENLEILRKLKELKWIDRGTRVVLLEIIFYNLNMNIFTNVRLIAERLPTGTLLTSCDIQMLPIYCIWSEQRSIIITVSTIFLMAIVFSLSREIWTLIKLGLYSYIRNIWKWLNLAFLISACTTIVLSNLHVLNMDSIIITVKQSTDELFLDGVFELYVRLKMALAMCTVLIWLKLFRFVSFNKTMLNFSLALRRGFFDILGFSIMFLIVFTAFATLGLLLFCKTNPAFSSYTESLVTMMRMLMTDFQYEHLDRADKLFGALFFILFILFIYFVLLNIFLAVISDSYVAVRQEDYSKYSILKAYFQFITKNIGDFFKNIKRSEKKPPDSKKVDFAQPRDIDKDEALNEFYDEPNTNDLKLNDTESDIEMPQRRRSTISETKKESERLIVRVKAIEAETEHFIEKMDRILQKLETMANEGQEK